MEADEKEFRIGFRHLILTIFLIVFLWASSGFVVYRFGDAQERGTFGDMFGAINALFSGLAFACLIFATAMQREELRLQRKELQLARQEAAATREEIKGQREEAERQNRLMATQADQNLFVGLLEQHNLLVDRLVINHYQNYLGRKSFEAPVSLFGTQYDTENKYSTNFNVEVAQRVCRDLPWLKNELQPYFFSLAGLLEFIDRSSLFPKINYATVIRNQFSVSEISTLVLICAFDIRPHNLKPLLEKHGMLIGFNPVALPQGEHIAKLVDARAFSE